jgi:hypothetical protein
MTPEQKETLRKEIDKLVSEFEWSGVYENDRKKILDFMVSKIEEKEAIFQQYYDLWNPVDKFVRNHPSIQIGDSVSAKALEMLQQSEAKIQAAREVEFERGAEEQRQILWKMFEEAGGTLSAFHTENYLDKPTFKSLDK